MEFAEQDDGFREGLNPSYGTVGRSIVGWVERSETHHSSNRKPSMGFASLYPSYDFSGWLAVGPPMADIGSSSDRGHRLSDQAGSFRVNFSREPPFLLCGLSYMRESLPNASTVSRSELAAWVVVAVN